MNVYLIGPHAICARGALRIQVARGNIPPRAGWVRRACYGRFPSEVSAVLCWCFAERGAQRDDFRSKNGAKMNQNRAKRVPKGSQKATKMHQKSIRAPGSIFEAKMVHSRDTFWSHFGTIFHEKVDQKTMPKSMSKKHENSSKIDPKREPNSIPKTIKFQLVRERVV